MNIINYRTGQGKAQIYAIQQFLQASAAVSWWGEPVYMNTEPALVKG